MGGAASSIRKKRKSATDPAPKQPSVTGLPPQEANRSHFAKASAHDSTSQREQTPRVLEADVGACKDEIDLEGQASHEVPSFFQQVTTSGSSAPVSVRGSDIENFDRMRGAANPVAEPSLRSMRGREGEGRSKQQGAESTSLPTAICLQTTPSAPAVGTLHEMRADQCAVFVSANSDPQVYVTNTLNLLLPPVPLLKI